MTICVNQFFFFVCCSSPQKEYVSLRLRTYQLDNRIGELAPTIFCMRIDFTRSVGIKKQVIKYKGTYKLTFSLLVTQYNVVEYFNMLHTPLCMKYHWNFWEIQEKLKEIIPRYSMRSDICSSFKYATTLYCVTCSGRVKKHSIRFRYWFVQKSHKSISTDWFGWYVWSLNKTSN